jgi:hypothetical protein
MVRGGREDRGHQKRGEECIRPLFSIGGEMRVRGGKGGANGPPPPLPSRPPLTGTTWRKACGSIRLCPFPAPPPASSSCTSGSFFSFGAVRIPPPPDRPRPPPPVSPPPRLCEKRYREEPPPPRPPSPLLRWEVQFVLRLVLWEAAQSHVLFWGASAGRDQAPPAAHCFWR